MGYTRCPRGDSPGSTVTQSEAWEVQPVPPRAAEGALSAFPQNFYKEIDRQAMYIR